jgi:carbamoyltransferase
MFEDIYIQPAAGDAGGALGAALAAWHIYYGNPRNTSTEGDRQQVAEGSSAAGSAANGLTPTDLMKGALLGPSFSKEEIERSLKRFRAFYSYAEEREICRRAAELIAKGKVVGWFQGRMEFGPRALGNRSILGDARDPEMQKKLNLKIKYRESFRPFAPSVLEENIGSYFELDRPSPYMLLVADIKEEHREKVPENYQDLPYMERLYIKRSRLPAITHVDFSARIQSVSRDTNPMFYELIRQYQEITGVGVLINTSFNVRGEPIVAAPEDAYRCFMRTEMDYLVMGNYLCDKEEQPEFLERENWRSRYLND